MNLNSFYLKYKGIIIAFISFFVLFLIIGYFSFLRPFFSGFKSNAPEKIVVCVYPNMSYEMLMDSIKLKVIDFNSFKRASSATKFKEKFRPGRYVFEKGTNNRVMIKRIISGNQTPYKLIISGNIRSTARLAAILGAKMAYDSTAFANCFNDTMTWNKYGYKAETFISLFIPNTYEVYWTITPEEFVERMKRENDRFWTPDRLSKAKALNFSKEQISTLASIVCEESNYKPELPMIAGVYINRLKTGMKLGADPTVKFALNDPSIKRILYTHLSIDSPYNTYKNTGLPPGPITIPSIAGIDAVLNSSKVGYMYFCASPQFDGRHKFATTFREHSRNAKAYQKALSTLKK